MSSNENIELSLTMRDRINYPYVLGNQLSIIQKAIGKEGDSLVDIEETVKTFINLIPSQMKDEEFYKEIENAIKKTKVDVRPKFAGVKYSVAYCKRKGIKIEDTIEVPDYFKMLNAIMNQLFRLGMLSKKMFTEIADGLPFGEEMLEDSELDKFIIDLDTEKKDE